MLDSRGTFYSFPLLQQFARKKFTSFSPGRFFPSSLSRGKFNNSSGKGGGRGGKKEETILEILANEKKIFLLLLLKISVRLIAQNKTVKNSRYFI